jgi:diadenosine tetraphosphatase ApaH/serine/threonine PP2A family protein phosphatase
MPLAAVIDDDIFCCHGGIPRKASNSSESFQRPRVHDILQLPNIMAITPRYEFETDTMNRTAMDILWGDPVKEDQEDLLGEDGFGQSLRGKGATCFGQKAVDIFLAEHNFSYIIRAHEAHAHGVSLRMSAKVFTVFSTSRDHGQGSKAQAGCILVDSGSIKFINKSSSYRNKFIHRITSKTFLGASKSIMDLRERLGLVDHTMDEIERMNSTSNIFSEGDCIIDEEEDDFLVNQNEQHANDGLVSAAQFPRAPTS